jgi:hypothetical protein
LISAARAEDTYVMLLAAMGWRRVSAGDVLAHTGQKRTALPPPERWFRRRRSA